tara:strand:+ start:142 stop:375 length:234 start_codon:yes stop_codon:yes gene_type:complete
MKNLSNGEIESYARDISEILEQIPLFYVYEVLEMANEKRQKENEIEGVDTTDSDCDSEEERCSSDEESEDSSDNDDY